ncbi:CBO0543 family protein [Neobacillus vireti]|uniref:CBO0543 family protein n=1 Tax=Neobacillus vireti TaxID=220686 RepID=UPI003000A406
MIHSTSGMQKSFWEYHKAYDHRQLAWKDEVLFTWEWWLGVALTIIPWIIWFIFRKRESTSRLLFAGTFVSLVSLTLDNIGVQFSAWNYLKPVIPAIPSYIPFDFALIPLSVMFLIQWFYHKNPWMIGLIFAILTAFIGEPIFKWLGIYVPTNWKYGYSIPFYTLIYYLAHKIASSKRFDDLEASK